MTIHLLPPSEPTLKRPAVKLYNIHSELTNKHWWSDFKDKLKLTVRCNFIVGDGLVV